MIGTSLDKGQRDAAFMDVVAEVAPALSLPKYRVTMRYRGSALTPYRVSVRLATTKGGVGEETPDPVEPS